MTGQDGTHHGSAAIGRAREREGAAQFAGPFGHGVQAQSRLVLRENSAAVVVNLEYEGRAVVEEPQ